MNPTFTVSIDTEKRKASAAGLVAVGEKVDVVVTGLDVTQIPEWEQNNDEGFTGPSLRFRLVAPDGKDLVRFPLAEGDAWTIGAEGELTAEVDFNTMPLRHWFHGYEIGAKAEVGIILDSIVDAMEYGRGTVKVLQWTASPAEDPTILPDWRKTLRDLNAAIVEIKDSVSLAEGYANNAEASAGVATEKAGVAETAANNALSSKSAAEGFKDAAQTAAGTATAKAEEAAASADTATTKAGEAADSAGDAAQILEDIEEAIAGKAEQSDLEAEVTRATQKEDELEDGLTEANDAISDNADAIDQLEESKADKTALDTLSDAIDSEAETREEKDAAICAKLNQEIGNRQSAIHNLNFAIQQEAYRAQVVEAGLVSMVSEKADKSDTYTKTEVDTKIAGVQTFKKYLVQTLPDPDEADMKGLYLVPTGETSEEGDLCEEWTVVEENGEKRWELIGGTTVDLDNYYTKSEVNGKLDEKQAKLYAQGQPGWTFSTESTGTEIEAFMADAANYSVTEEQSGSAWLYTLTGYDEENYYVAPVGRTAQSTSIPFYVFDVTQTSMYGSVLAEYSSVQSDVPAQVDTTPTANSGRLVTSGGIWSAIWGALSTLPTGFSSLYDWVVDKLAEKLDANSGTMTGTFRLKGVLKVDTGDTTTYELDYYGIRIYVNGGTKQIHMPLSIPYADSGYMALVENLAPGFSTSATYYKDDLVKYNGTLYMCMATSHTGAWSNSDFAMASVQGALARKLGHEGPWVNGYIDVLERVTGESVPYGVRIYRDKIVFGAFTNTTPRGFTPIREFALPSAGGTLALTDDLLDKLDSTSAAPAFSSSSTYAVGDHVTYNGALYRCTTAVTTAGAWTGSTNWTADTMTDPDAVLDVTSQNQLRVVAKDGTLLWAQGYDLASTSSATLACDAANNFTFADGATSQAFTLPTAPTGKVGDFGLDIDNSANTGAATMTLTGLDTAFSVVVPKGESLTDMLSIAAGELARFYISLSTFRVNNLPTWHILKQVVENGGAQS